MTFDNYVKQLQSIILKGATEKVFSLLVSKFAFLAGGPLGYIAKKIIFLILKKAIYETEMAIFFKYTDVRVNSQGKKFYTAMEAHEAAKIGGTEEEKQNAEKDVIDSFRNFIKLVN